MKTEAATLCPHCGAKFREGLRRCPRCRAVMATPDPAVEAVRSGQLRTIAAALVGVAGLLLAVMWLTQGAPPAPASNPVVAAAVTPRPAAVEATAPAAVTQPSSGLERPFMDPPAAAYVAYSAGDMPSALRHYEQAVARNPNDADALSNLGQVLVRLNRTQEAIPFFERAIAIVPDKWAYRFNLARAFGVLGRWNDAVASYREAQRLFPDDYATAFNLGLALHKAGDDTAAVEAFQKAISLDPNEPTFRMALAMTYEGMQQPSAAAAAYEEALRLSPQAPDAEAVRRRIAQLRGPAPAGGRG